jgi:hypothetical protein
MSTATSVVGTWIGHVAWGCSGAPVSNSSTVWTFHSDGTWTYEFGGGFWIQVEGLVAWNFKADKNEPPIVASSLVYTANVTRNALDGIMGYPVSGASPGTGCFYAVRQEEAVREAAVREVAPSKGHDHSKGPRR